MVQWSSLNWSLFKLPQFWGCRNFNSIWPVMQTWVCWPPQSGSSYNQLSKVIFVECWMQVCWFIWHCPVWKIQLYNSKDNSVDCSIVTVNTQIVLVPVYYHRHRKLVHSKWGSAELYIFPITSLPLANNELITSPCSELLSYAHSPTNFQ